MNYKKVSMFFSLFILLFSFVTYRNAVPVYAEGGAWLGPENIPDEGTGSGSGGGTATRSYSWVKYQSLVDEGQEIYFAPYTPTPEATAIAKKVKISKECSDGKGKYFWHIGTNMQSDDINGRGVKNGLYGFGNYRSPLTLYQTGFPWSDTSKVYWADKTMGNDSEYASLVNRASGHGDTRMYSTFLRWDVNNSADGWYEEKVLSNLSHVLYYKGNAIFQAKESAPTSKVFEEFKKAFENEYGVEYDEKNENHKNKWLSTYAFCAWDDDEEPQTLTVIGKNIYDNSNIPAGNKSVSVTKGSPLGVERTNLSNSTPAYTFIGWKTSASAGTSNIITRTSNSQSPFVSEASSHKFYQNNSEKTVYKKINYTSFNNDTTVYAYYARKYTLFKEPDHTTITVKRKGATYTSKETTTLADKSTIYKLDELDICVTADRNYGLTSIKVKNGSNATETITNDSKKYCNSDLLTADGDVTIKATAEQRTLKGYAVTENGTLLNNEKPICSVTVAYGGSASCKKSSIDGYTYQGWRTSKTSGQLNESDTYTVNSLTANSEVYFVYKINRYTLKMVSYSTNNKSLDDIPGLAPISRTVNYDETATISHGNNQYFIFQGYKSSGECAGDGVGINYLTNTDKTKLGCTNGTRGYYLSGKASNGGTDYATYNYARLWNNASIWAKYAPKKYTLTATADAHSTITVERTTASPYTSSSSTGLIVNNLRGGSTAVDIYYGDVLNITIKADNDCYTLSQSLTGLTSPVTKDVTVIASTALKSYDLIIDRAAGSGINVDRSDSPNGGGNTSNPLYNESSATSDKTTRSKAIYCGDILKAKFSLMPNYSWGSHLFKGAGVEDRLHEEISKHTVKGDVIVETKDVIRNNFKGRASVAEGTNWSGTTNRKATGWVVGDGSNTEIQLDCANDGCKANFWLELKSVAGSGTTFYNIGKKNNNDSIRWDKAADVLFGQNSNSLVLGTNSDVGEQITLSPGQSYCRYLKFKPYITPTGEYDDNYEAIIRACAKAAVSEFQGKSLATSSGKTASVGFTNQNLPESRLVISDCSSSSGCNATIQHMLKRTSGVGSTNYKIVRTSRFYKEGVLGAVKPETLVENGVYSQGDKPVLSSEIKLVPGQVVCEILSFTPNNDSTKSQSKVATKVCVSAEGKAQSDGGDAFVDMKVKNNSVTKYNTYSDEPVYGKPGDAIAFRASYNPELQYTYYLAPEKMRINGGAIIGNNNNSLMWKLFNDNRGSLGTWKNGVALSRNFGDNSKTPFVRNGGVTTKDMIDREVYNVGSNDVGKSLTDIVVTNQYRDEVKTTPSQVIFTDENGSNVANVITTSISDSASAIIPYNFLTDVTLDSTGNNVVYAGENKSIKYTVQPKPKPNKETTNNNEEYVTKIDNGEIRLIQYSGNTEKAGNLSYRGDPCGHFGNDCKVVATKSSINIKPGDALSSSISSAVPDSTAGSSICFAVAFYPANSGSDTETEASGSETWNISDSKCYTVAKKPSFQVWGGSMYINGSANVPFSAKKNLAGYENDNNNNYHVFGSWVEIGLTAGGTVTGLASGAATGYSDINNDGKLIRDPGGSTEATLNFCTRSPLSITNSGCNGSNGVVGKLTGSTNKANADTLVNKLFPNINSSSYTNHSEESLNISDAGSYDEKGNTRVTYSSNDLTINAASISNGITHVVYSDKTIKINGNLTYIESAPYGKLTEVPKFIIYAGENIVIGCNVTQIDAVLLTKGTVNTCDSGDVNNEVNSTKLRINGMVIANILELNRTYGAGPGNYSIIPAEIFNLDTTLYLWSSSTAGTGGDAGKFTQSYIHELAPRY